MNRRHFTLAAVAAAASGGIATRVAAQPAWSPSKPVRIVTGAPGAILDIAARQLAERLQPALGQPVVVENKAGGGGIVSMEAVRGSAPDGHTIGLTTFVEMTINPALYDRLPYDPVKDFAPVTVLYAGPLVFVANASFPADTLADVIRLAKQQPGKYFYGSSGVARPPHVWAERFKHTAGVDLVHVPFKGGAPLTQALLAGEVTLGIEGAPPLLPHIKAGKLKALAVTGDKRMSELPDVPTFAEAGVPGIGLSWVGVVAPAGTPPAAVERLQVEIVRAMQSPEIRTAYQQAGRVVMGNTPQEFAAMIRAELPEWGRMVKATGLRPE